MSEVFHKSCYTSRSTGYKYRTLSTNTGDKKHRDSEEDNVFDKKFKELRKAIFSRIDNELDQTQKSRQAIFNKFDKINSKIDSIITLKENFLGMRKTICAVENKLEDITEKINKLELYTEPSDVYSVNSIKSRTPIYPEKDNIGSEVSQITHV